MGSMEPPPPLAGDVVPLLHFSSILLIKIYDPHSLIN